MTQRDRDASLEKFRKVTSGVLGWGIILTVSGIGLTVFDLLLPQSVMWELLGPLIALAVVGLVLLPAGLGLRKRKPWARKLAVAGCILGALVIAAFIVLSVMSVVLYARANMETQRDVAKLTADGFLSESDVRDINRMRTRYVGGTVVVILLVLLIFVWRIVRVVRVACTLCSHEFRKICGDMRRGGPPHETRA